MGEEGHTPDSDEVVGICDATDLQLFYAKATNRQGTNHGC
jgi:hypothetical protein